MWFIFTKLGNILGDICHNLECHASEEILLETTELQESKQLQE